MREGFVYLHRKLLDNPVFDNPHMLKVWIWCLLKASHAKHDTLVGLRNITLMPGQFIFGRFKAAAELKMKPSSVRNYMAYLERYQMIINNSDNKYTLVTVTNWALYQTYNKNLDTNRTATGQQQDTNNNGNTGDTANTVFKNENNNAPLPDGKEGVTVQERREPHDQTVDNAITYYWKTYRKKYRREPPNLKPEQWQHVRDVLKGIQDETGFDDDGWEEFIDRHHKRNLETDGNILHFVTEGILQNLLYKTFY
jgi:hypothetical protein